MLYRYISIDKARIVIAQTKHLETPFCQLIGEEFRRILQINTTQVLKYPVMLFTRRKANPPHELSVDLSPDK